MGVMSTSADAEKVPKEIYEAELTRLQVELSHLKDWVVDTGYKLEDRGARWIDRGAADLGLQLTAKPVPGRAVHGRLGMT